MKFRGAVLFGILAAVCLQASPWSDQLNGFVEDGTLVGAITAVVSADKVLAVDVAGYADVASKRPMAEDALFWIASQTKMFTGVAVMMMVDEGKISLDDPITKYLPQFNEMWVEVKQKDGQAPAAANLIGLGTQLEEVKAEDVKVLVKSKTPITVRMAMSHTVGFPFLNRLESGKIDTLSQAERMLVYAASPLQFEPGTAYRYSQAGINIGGRIVEIASGMTYDEFLKKRIFEPLGMKDTTFWPTEEQMTRLATCYNKADGSKEWKPRPIWAFTQPYTDKTKRFAEPGGGLFSTVGDVSKFCQMLLRGGTAPDGKRLISEESIKVMSSKQTPEKVQAGYGIGTGLDPDGFQHGGALQTLMKIKPGKGLAMVWLVQREGDGKGNSAAQAKFFNWAEQQKP